MDILTTQIIKLQTLNSETNWITYSIFIFINDLKLWIFRSVFSVECCQYVWILNPNRFKCFIFIVAVLLNCMLGGQVHVSDFWSIFEAISKIFDEHLTHEVTCLRPWFACSITKYCSMTKCVAFDENIYYFILLYNLSYNNFLFCIVHPLESNGI